MKQLALILFLTLAGTLGVFLFTPFLGVAVYYLFAVLRPQYLWEWALTPYLNPRETSWSFYVAVCTILAALAQRFGVMSSAPQLAGGTGRGPGLSATHWTVLAFGGWVGVSYEFAYDQPAAYFWFIEYVKIFVMFATSAFLIFTIRQLWVLLLLATVAVSYIGYEVNSLYLQTRRITIYHNGFGGLDNNGAGLLLAMGVPLCLFVWEGTRSWWRWLFAASIPSLIHAVMMSYSRGAMVALILASPLFYLRSRYKGTLSAALLGLAFLIPVLAGKEIRERFFSIQSYEKDKSAQSRFDSWWAAWEMARDHPIVGVGIRNSNLLAKTYGADREGRTIHSQYLQIAADTGFVGLGLYLYALASVWSRVRRVQYRLKSIDDPESRQTHAVACGVECSMAVFCAGALFLSLELFELPYLLLLLGAQLGSLLELKDRPAPAAPARDQVPAPTPAQALGS